MTSFLTSSNTILAATALAVITAAAGYLVYQQRDTLFGNRGYNQFEKKYAAQLLASRQQVSESRGRCSSSRGGSGTTDAAAGHEQEVSSFAKVKVIYGSDSGNAEAFAKGLVMTLNDRGVQAALIDPSRWLYLDRYARQNPKQHSLFQFPQRSTTRHADTQTSAGVGSQPGNGTRSEQLRQQQSEGEEEEILLFVVSTAGEGEPTCNFLSLFQEMQQAVQRSHQLRSPASATGPGALPSRASSRGEGKAGSQGQSLLGKAGASPGSSLGSLPKPVFSHVKYAVFALGDSSYKYYCRAGMTVNTLLKTGGGQELQRIGFGDARGGSAKQEESFEEWQDGVLRALVQECGVVLTAGSMDPPKPQMRYSTFPPSTGGVGAMGPAPFPPPPPLFEPSQHRPSLIQLTRKEKLTAPRSDDGSAVYRFTFSIDGTNLSYQAGDHLGIFPANPPAVVERCAALLGLSEQDLANEVELQEARTRTVMCNALPARVTLRTALSYYTDLCGKPKKSALRVLAKYCRDAAEKAAFLEAVDAEREASIGAATSNPSSPAPLTTQGSSGGVSHGGTTAAIGFAQGAASRGEQDDSRQHAPRSSGGPVSAPKPTGVGRPAGGANGRDRPTSEDSGWPRTVLDYMEAYPSCCNGAVPVGHFLEMMPRIQPRYYSIATDRTTHPRELQIFVRTRVDGLTSNFLAHRVIVAGDDVKKAGGSSADNHRAQRPMAGPQQTLSHDERWHDLSMVFAYVRVSAFHLPASLPPSAPILLIGPGTGAAAMIGLLYRREALMRRHPTDAHGDCLFFFGARHRASEFFIKDEVERWHLAPEQLAAWDAAHPTAPISAATRQAKDKRQLRSRVITTLECAFSRDGDADKRMYVTGLIDKHADLIYDMITNNAESMIYLSGDATSMAKDVDKALVAIIQAKGKMGRLSALNVLQKMESEHRYLKDVY